MAGTEETFAQRRYTVTALLSPMPVGTSFARKDWPAHVTLAGNFVAGASTDEIVATVRAVGVLAEPTVIRFGGSALFGPNHDVPVRLALPGRVMTLHEHLAEALEMLPGFSADQPEFWRAGYRPHFTLSSAISLAAGAARSIVQIAIAQLSRETATIVATVEIRAHDPD